MISDILRFISAFDRANNHTFQVRHLRLQTEVQMERRYYVRGRHGWPLSIPALLQARTNKALFGRLGPETLARFQPQVLRSHIWT